MRVAIAGAGIAGLTAAIALAQRGIEAAIFERAVTLVEIGAGIQLSPNAVAVLETLGALAGIRDRLTEPTAIEIREARSGRALASIPLGDEIRRRYGLPYYVVHRADLQTGLVETARREGVALHLGAEVRDPSTTGGQVSFIAGAAAYRADVLLVADGVHSALRTQAFGYRRARSLGHVAWRASIPIADVPASISRRATGLWLGRAAHLVHYVVSGGKDLNVVAIAAVDTTGTPAPRPPRAAFGAEAMRLMDAAAAWNVHPLFATDPAGPWVRGRIALAGDAAHGMAPSAAQGGAQAIEDGWVIAWALGACGSDVTAALQSYDRARRPRAERVARHSRSNLGVYEIGSPAASARNLVLRTLPASFLLSRLDWLYGWRPPPNIP